MTGLLCASDICIDVEEACATLAHVCTARCLPISKNPTADVHSRDYRIAMLADQPKNFIGEKVYQYFADAYLMANQTWFDSLPADLQELVVNVGKEVGTISTNTILDAGEATLEKFQDKGGIVTVLSGSEREKFDKLMNDKLMPKMADLIDKDAFEAAKAFVSN